MQRDNANVAALSVFIGYKKGLTIRRSCEIAGPCILALLQRHRLGLAFQHLLQREKRHASVGHTDG